MLYREVLEKSVVETSWGRVLWRSVGEECCRDELGKSVVEKCWRREECCRDELGKSVLEKCWRRVLLRSVVQTSWGRVL